MHGLESEGLQLDLILSGTFGPGAPSVNTALLFLCLVAIPQTLDNLSGICPVQALPDDVGG